MARCKLCLAEKVLCRSHIIPEFFYKPMYDQKHRLILMSNIHLEPVKFRLKGVYENLLCNECEAIINEHESYVIQQLTDLTQVRYSEDDRFIKYDNFNYDHFRLFALSILWRASISSNRLFQEVDLGRNEDIIRQMILTGNAGSFDQYPILMAAIMTGKKKKAMDLITNPELIKVNECWAYRFVFGGFVWLFLFGDTSNFSMKRFYFQPYGSMTIPKRDMSDANFLVEFGFELQHQGKLGVDLSKLRR